MENSLINTAAEIIKDLYAANAIDAQQFSALMKAIELAQDSKDVSSSPG